MGVETLISYKIAQNEHVEYKHAIPLEDVTFKDTVLALHEADEFGTLTVIEGAENITVEQFISDMKGTEICLVEFDGIKVGYFVGAQESGFYLGPEVDLVFLKENKPESFAQIQEAPVVGPGQAPKMQPQLSIGPSTPGLGGGGHQGGGAMPPQQQQQTAAQQGQPQGQMSMQELLNLIKSQHQQGGGNDDGSTGGGNNIV